MENIIVLGIESTSHTFGVGIVKYVSSINETRILANTYDKYIPEKGGIHPREAALHHARVAAKVLSDALQKANISMRDVSAIAVALGPGLGPCLRVGASLARFLSSYYNIPLIPVNHAVAHIEIGKFLFGFKDPLIIYVSGGNTLIAIQRKKRYRILGETLDIPIGNLLDTFAREIGLAPPYIVNGKHQVDICAEWGSEFISLPYTVKGSDLSFSGLLTAALSLAEKYIDNKKKLGNVCLSLRETAFNMLVEVAERSLVLAGKKEVLLVGGVASNKVLRKKLELMASLHGAKYAGTPPEYSGDNGAMIAYTGLLGYLHNVIVEPRKAFVRQRWRLDEVELPWIQD
ncbi:KEOPS complex N(6)-L-threonylcarbamoyladenine synthase Kae1 [Staphylothermus marinus]|uniref:KEOPS complex N(6)-L-threonylcarbamoyladenine synthase Kae1 n=1 Tax=Staphylothermus marinus TaxID=2280 RepID=UPI001FCC5E78|nr:KEOPS complex N(6)-L-threonylcarbamoyladenine synthase Kae1 [Staphylothermus marinus]